MADRPMTRADLAQRYGVSHTTITRALARAEDAHKRDPAHPRPPQPINPDRPILLWDLGEFDRWWASRPGRGRPANKRGAA